MKPSSLKNTPEQASLQVQAYLAALPEDAQKHVRKLRDAIHSAARGSVESFGYGMPAYSLDGKPFINGVSSEVNGVSSYFRLEK